ncbi:hypothetical protein SacmaDRAFT_2628 [Saccharomonospora marina XMU15]|uniref:Uncharacterized protein n=1 Tax=Saccharomonospora marina XMU15 TaxID=882083 RepID=H5X0S4_9PSEU|nr:DUF6069 family protein [Saccharomonospora marina]EHR50870.1 hypothetical protein SacmaDRAFT_2628 [Saccharomonospora marina XMU15]
MKNEVDSTRLWAGGAATAAVAALVAVVGILTARGLAHVAVLAPRGEGAWGGANTVTYAVSAAVVAVAATGLLHVLLLTAPRPRLFFGWIMALLTAIAIVLPLSLYVDWGSKVATALINLAIGFAIIVTLLNVGKAAQRESDRDHSDDSTQQFYP